MKASNGSPVMSLGQLSKAQASDAIKRMNAAIKDKGE